MQWCRLLHKKTMLMSRLLRELYDTSVLEQNRETVFVLRFLLLLKSFNVFHQLIKNVESFVQYVYVDQSSTPVSVKVTAKSCFESLFSTLFLHVWHFLCPKHFLAYSSQSEVTETKEQKTKGLEMKCMTVSQNCTRKTAKKWIEISVMQICQIAWLTLKKSRSVPEYGEGTWVQQFTFVCSYTIVTQLYSVA